MVKKEYMDKFKKLKLYALKKKTHQIDKHNGHYTNSMRDIQNFIEGVKDRSIIGLKFERILRLVLYYPQEIGRNMEEIVKTEIGRAHV